MPYKRDKYRYLIDLIGLNFTYTCDIVALYFNTLTATGSLSAGLRSNFIDIQLINSGVTNEKIQNGAVTPVKQSGTLT